MLERGIRLDFEHEFEQFADEEDWWVIVSLQLLLLAWGEEFCELGDVELDVIKFERFEEG